MAGNGHPQAAAPAFPGPNVMALVRNESPSDALAAMLASCPPVGLPVQRAGMELTDAVVGCGQKRGYYGGSRFEGGLGQGQGQGEDVGGEEDLGDDCGAGGHNVEKKRRLSFDQVRSLERNFEVENKLEPERKMQLARELGLQPRQVAVWFQNRRARWKTKQLERDYEVLTLDYNRLKSDYDAVLQEKRELEGEIECLTGKLQASPQPGAVDDQTAPEIKPAAPAKTSAAVSQGTLPSPKSPEADSEAAVKSEKMAPTELAAATPSVGKGEEVGFRDTCSESISSEILDADSPRAMDSAPHLEKSPAGIHPPVSSTSAGITPPDSNAVHVNDHLSEQILSPAAPGQRIPVKLEDGSFQEESSCNYILTQLDEERALPWWDWP